MAQPAQDRGKRNNGNRNLRSRSVRDELDDETDDNSEGEGFHVAPEEFLEMATGIRDKAQQNPLAIARIIAERTEARRKKNYWKQRALAAEDGVPEDAVVLTGDEAAAYNKLRERPNFEFTKVPSLLETLETKTADLTAENLKHKNKAIFAEFSKVSGYNADAVEGVVDNLHLHAELGDVTVEKEVNGQKTTETKKTMKVRRSSDPKAPLVPFDEYVDTNAKWAKPALTSAQPNGHPGYPSAIVAEQGPTTGATASGNPVVEFIQQQNAAVGTPLQRGAQAPRGLTPAQRQ